MGLENFNSSKNEKSSDSKEATALLEVSESFRQTPCDCDISDIDICPSFNTLGEKLDKRKMNELDIVGHLREEHGWSFNKAVKRVTILQTIKEK